MRLRLHCPFKYDGRLLFHSVQSLTDLTSFIDFFFEAIIVQSINMTPEAKGNVRSDKKKLVFCYRRLIIQTLNENFAERVVILLNCPEGR